MIKPYPAEPVRACCEEEGQSSVGCVWHKSGRRPGWWRSQPHHWGRATGLPSPPVDSAGQYPAAHAETAAGPVSRSGTPALLEGWAGKSPTQMRKTKPSINFILVEFNITLAHVISSTATVDEQSITFTSVLTAYLNGEESPRHLQNRRIVEIFGEEFNVDGGRHEDKSQIRSQGQKWTQNSQQEVAVQVSLVNLVHD